jgi:heterodisulfide reductase subunit A-like polyferredoxin/coenzyme F420-reducing hydrogenase delta subunit
MTTAKTARETETIDLATDVLVIGGGHTGIRAAAAIAEAGYRVILAEQETVGGAGLPSLYGLTGEALSEAEALERSIDADSRIERLAGARLKEAAGVPGDFTVRLTSAFEDIEKKVGAVVVATDIESEPLLPIYGLSKSEKILTLSDFEDRLADPEFIRRLGEAGKNVAFLVGFAQEGTPLLMKRVLQSVLAVSSAGGASAYIYVNHLKVAGENLERLYKEGRDRGAIYFKLTEPPAVEAPSGFPLIRFNDPVLRTPIEFAPDYLVVEEAMTPSQINSEIAEILRLHAGPMGLLQTDNVHRFPIASNREGIYVVGPAREIETLPEAWTDAANAALAAKELLGDGTRQMPRFRAEVDREKCVTCLTCYRCCPHGAIYWDDKAVISPVACQACGICASECPQEAIQVTGFTDDAVIADVRACLSDVDEGSARILAFCCENSSLEAGRAAALFHLPLPEGLRMVRVPCAGKVDIHYILSAFIEGADGVLVMACHPGNCKSETGTTFARWRVENAYRMLKETGIGKDRLSFVTLASNMAGDFSKIAVEMERRIG